MEEKMNKKAIKDLKKIKVNLNKEGYPIFIGRSIIEIFKRTVEKYDRILILTNKTISNIYKDKLVDITHGLDNIYVYRISDGARYRSLSTLSDIYDYMSNNDFKENSCIIALGGGVICDIGGFVAGTYMSGIDCIYMPTSLVAQIDSSVSNIVGIDHNAKEHLLSLKKSPKGVIIDVDLLNTLPDIEYLKGIQKAIEYAVIAHTSGNKRYFNMIERYRSDLLARDTKKLIEIIGDTCREKKSILEGTKEYHTFEECIAQ